MANLDPNWLIQNHIDFEYKKYMLLAFLKSVQKSFKETKLFPSLSDLIFHYQNLEKLKKNQELMRGDFPKEMSQVDFSKLKIIYNEIVEDDKLMTVIREIMQYALPRMENHLKEGKEIYDFIEENMELEPVGIIPIHTDEGYLFVTYKENNKTTIYEYCVTLFEDANDKYRGIHLTQLESTRKTISTTFENLKLDLIQKYQKLFNPATFLVTSSLQVPFEETVVPMAKRMLIRHLAEAA